MNTVHLIGNVGRVNELKKFDDGGALLSFSLATTYSYKKGDQYEKGTDWHNCVIKGKRASGIAPFIVKGMQLFVSGALRTRKYDSSDGEKRSITEVIVKEVEFGKPPKGHQDQATHRSPYDDNTDF